MKKIVEMSIHNLDTESVRFDLSDFGADKKIGIGVETNAGLYLVVCEAESIYTPWNVSRDARGFRFRGGMESLVMETSTYVLRPDKACGRPFPTRWNYMAVARIAELTCNGAMPCTVPGLLKVIKFDLQEWKAFRTNFLESAEGAAQNTGDAFEAFLFEKMELGKWEKNWTRRADGYDAIIPWNNDEMMGLELKFCSHQDGKGTGRA